jgi:hypothetical protein
MMSKSVQQSILRGFALATLASLLVVMQAVSSPAQWVTNGSTINNTNPGGVGVGVADPSLSGAVGSKFTVVTTDDNATAIATGNGTFPRFALNNHSNGSWTMHDYVGNIWHRGITQHSGNVGIGLSSPAYKLDVNGEINATGLRINGTSLGAQWTMSGSNVYYNTGNIGIGTTTPSTAKLVVSGSAGAEGLDLASSDQYANLRVIRNSLSGYDKDLYLQYGAGAASKIRFYSNNVEGMTLTDGNLGIGTTTPSSKLHVIGDITVSGNISAKYQDVAEWVPSREKLSAGTVVILDIGHNNHVAASSTPYDTRVAGVISAQPGISLGEAGEGKALVATTGRVKVKVDATRAPIRVGDLLVTSDASGVAMRSQPLDLGGVPIHRPGTLIGKALEPLEKGTGEILVLLSLQ